jgi:hypothetical protein
MTFELPMQLTGIFDSFEFMRQINHVHGLAGSCDGPTVSRLGLCRLAVMSGAEYLAGLAGDNSDFHDLSPSRC